MRIEIEYKDIVFLREIVREKQDLYKKQIMSGYVDDNTSIDTINEIESKEKIVSKIFKILNQY
tara:strand:+ start:560 stop:748 length:189 start_codon:yes stop_codon:yes gene_type:complete